MQNSTEGSSSGISQPEVRPSHGPQPGHHENASNWSRETSGNDDVPQPSQVVVRRIVADYTGVIYMSTNVPHLENFGYGEAMPRKQMSPSGTAIYSLQQQFGWRRAVWILDFLARWSMAMQANNWEPINAEQFAEHWHVSRAKGYRDKQRWADLFPHEPDPTARILAGRAEYERLVAEQGKQPSAGDVAALMGTLPA